MTRRRLIALGSGAFLLAVVARTAVSVDAQGPGQAEFFEQRVRPVLAESCLGCHDSTAMGGLRLDSRENVLKGGKSGPAIVVGDPDNSALIAAVRQTGSWLDLAFFQIDCAVEHGIRAGKHCFLCGR